MALFVLGTRERDLDEEMISLALRVLLIDIDVLLVWSWVILGVDLDYLRFLIRMVEVKLGLFRPGQLVLSKTKNSCSVLFESIWSSLAFDSALGLILFILIVKALTWEAKLPFKTLFDLMILYEYLQHDG